MIHGPDVSFYQDAPTTPQQIDFKKMRDVADFVIIRAGQNTWEDEDFRHNWQAAKEAGLPRGTYWFFDNRSAPSTQANIWRALVGNDLPELGFWYDLEENYKGAFAGWKNWKQLIQIMQAYYQNSLHGIYTAPAYWKTNRPLNTNDSGFFKSLPLWIANYGVSQPEIPAPWTSWLFWQYGTPAVGIEYGAESIEIDMNYFNGDADKFKSVFGIGGSVPQEGGTMAGYYKLDTTAANIRTGPGASYTDKGDLVQGDVIEETGRSGSWSKYRVAQHSNGNPVTLANGTPLDTTNTVEYWSTNAYFVQVSGLPNPTTPPPTDPPPSGDTYVFSADLQISLTDQATGAVYKGVVAVSGLELVKQ